MKSSEKQHHVFLIDDDIDVLQVMSRALEQRGLEVSRFTCAADCLKKLRSQTCDLLITDLKMPEMDGIKLLAKVKSMIPSLPVLVITGYGDIPAAVKAMKVGALDFIEKPLDRESFLSSVESALKQNAGPCRPVAKVLTKTEMSILRQLLEGYSTKEMARLQHRSVRTIEDHRHHIMHKLGVNNLVELVKQAAVVRLMDIHDAHST